MKLTFWLCHRELWTRTRQMCWSNNLWIWHAEWRNKFYRGWLAKFFVLSYLRFFLKFFIILSCSIIRTAAVHNCSSKFSMFFKYWLVINMIRTLVGIMFLLSRILSWYMYTTTVESCLWFWVLKNMWLILCQIITRILEETKLYLFFQVIHDAIS